MRPIQGNVEAVKNAPEPTNVSELKSFLGMINYYHSYIPNMATETEPLHQLLRKGVQWHWSMECRSVFVRLKEMLCKAPVLTYFDANKPIIVHCDASPYGVGAVLSHIMENGEERPVCYGSRTLSSAERNYGHVEKEGLALVYAVRKFHQYLFGMQFKMVTDHKPLLGLFAEDVALPVRAAGRVLRWAMLLSAYNYKLEYRLVGKNGNADGLRRLPMDAHMGEFSQPMRVNMMELINASVTAEEIRTATQKEPLLSAVLSKVLHGWVGNVSESLKPFEVRKDELSTELGCLIWGGRVIVPEKLRGKVLGELHEVHPGTSRMKALARSYVWWPGIDKDIEGMVRDCVTCAANQRNPVGASLHAWEYPAGPWERIHIDFAGPLDGKMYLVVVDAYSKWLDVEMMSSSKAGPTIAKLRRLFAVHGLPHVVVSDNGPNFASEEFKLFLKKNGIRQMFTAPYHPASNGQVERMVRTFKESFKTLKEGDAEL